jgi:hypothetical protein
MRQQHLIPCETWGLRSTPTKSRERGDSKNSRSIRPRSRESLSYAAKLINAESPILIANKRFSDPDGSALRQPKVQRSFMQRNPAQLWVLNRDQLNRFNNTKTEKLTNIKNQVHAEPLHFQPSCRTGFYFANNLHDRIKTFFLEISKTHVNLLAVSWRLKVDHR